MKESNSYELFRIKSRFFNIVDSTSDLATLASASDLACSFVTSDWKKNVYRKL